MTSGQVIRWACDRCCRFWFTESELSGHRCVDVAAALEALLSMKVSIEDGDALGRVSPTALTTYVEQHGWTVEQRPPRADGRPPRTGYYEHPRPGQRLPAQIACPLHRDYADYSGVIGYAVSTLARVEDRSQLSVWSDLIALTEEEATPA